MFFILWEWLRPLPLLAPFENHDIFLWLLAWFGFSSIPNWSFWLRGVWNAFGAAGVIYYLFAPSLLPEQTWMEYVKLELIYNYEQIFLREYHLTTSFIRSAGFVLLLWIAVQIVFSAVLKRGQAIGLSIATFTLLVLLDVSTIYEVKAALLRVTLLCLGLLALQQLRSVERMGVQAWWGKSSRLAWLMAVSVLILSITLVAYVVPKPREAAVLDLGWSAQGGAGSHRVGYESRDQRLGGPFIDDETVVFVAETTEKHYWRGESRSIYTGTEWKDTQGTPSNWTLQDSISMEPLIRNKKVDDKEVVVKVHFPNPRYNLLFYGGILQKINLIQPEPLRLFSSGNQEVKVQFASEGQYLAGYEARSYIPLINEEALKTSSTAYPSELRNYLQLPASLPSRVFQLAEEVTKDHTDPYSKAYAIQQYLKYSGGYVYEKLNVPYVGEGQDFVDQFLFETKQGYCDHFSSSMTVMLRTLGIPARYVKGFSTGDMVFKSGDSYEVTMRNKNAHSWVEVYFAEYGWVTFEPTPGFVHPTKQDREETQQEQEAAPASSIIPPVAQDLSDRLLELEEETVESSATQSGFRNWILILFTLAIILAVVMVVKKQTELRFWYLYHKGKRVEHAEGIANLYLSVLEALGSTFSRRKTGESLQEFVARLTLNQQSKADLKQLTDAYERHIYGNRSWKEQEVKQTKSVMRKFLRHFLS